MFSRWLPSEQTWGKAKISNIIFGENFDTSNVTDMGDMFSGVYVKTLDLSRFNTSKVTNMYSMFAGCINIEKLNLNNDETIII